MLTPRIYVRFFIYSWDRASLDMEILYMTNKMQLIIFIVNDALHVSGVYRPSSGAHELYVQLMVLASLIYVIIGNYTNYSLWKFEYVIRVQLQIQVFS